MFTHRTLFGYEPAWQTGRAHKRLVCFSRDLLRWAHVDPDFGRQRAKPRGGGNEPVPDGERISGRNWTARAQQVRRGRSKEWNWERGSERFKRKSARRRRDRNRPGRRKDRKAGIRLYRSRSERSRNRNGGRNTSGDMSAACPHCIVSCQHCIRTCLTPRGEENGVGRRRDSKKTTLRSNFRAMINVKENGDFRVKITRFLDVHHNACGFYRRWGKRGRQVCRKSLQRRDAFRF